MHTISFFITLTLFFFVASSSAQPHREEVRRRHQTITRSVGLSLRQYTNDASNCIDACNAIDEKITAECNLSDACSCSPTVSVPLHDCAQCAYQISIDAASKADLVNSYKEYVDACASAGHPIQGDTTLSDGFSVESEQQASSSPASASTPIPTSSTVAFKSSAPSATLSAGGAGLLPSLGSANSKSNSAGGLSHGSIFGVGLGAVAITTFACLML